MKKPTATDQLAGQAHAIVGLEARVAELDLELEARAETIARLTAEHVAEPDDYRELATKLRALLDATEAALAEARQRADTVTAHVDHQVAAAPAAATRIAELEEQLADTEARRARAEGQHARELDQVRAELAAADAIIGDLRAPAPAGRKR